MPGTITFKPLEANLSREKETLFQLDPYCKFSLGWHSAQSSVARGQGKHPHWKDSVSLERKHNEHAAKLVVKDSDSFTLDDFIGETQIELDSVLDQGKVSKWFDIKKHGKVVGEVLVEMEYTMSL